MVDRDGPDGDLGRLNGQSINDVQNLASAVDVKAQAGMAVVEAGYDNTGRDASLPEIRSAEDDEG